MTKTAKDDEQTFAPRYGRPSATYTFNDYLVGQVELVTDKSGMVEIVDAAEDRVASLLHLSAKPPKPPKPAATPAAPAAITGSE